MSDGEHLDWSDTPSSAHPLPEAPDSTMSLNGEPDTLVTLEEMEARYIRQVLDQVGGSQSKAATILGVNRTTLWRKLRISEES